VTSPERALGPDPQGVQPADRSIVAIDRVGPARRPDALLLGYQRWDSMLFLHWPIDARVLKPLVPARLSVDTCDGTGWVSVTAFTVTGARLRGLPHLPGLTKFHEVNVRTYVHLDGKNPGIWFLSLDASNALACALAHLTVRLPYFPARIVRGQVGSTHSFRLKRWQPHAELNASWRIAGGDVLARPGTLEAFLTERYLLYSRALGRKLLRQQVHHRPWILRKADRVEVTTTLARASGLPSLNGAPLAHDSPGVDAEVFAPALV
jgi:uncharacterized protein